MKLIRMHMVGVAVAAALGASGCVSQGEYDKLQADKNSEVAALQKQSSALQQERSALQQELDRLQSQRMALERQQASLRGEVATLQKQRDQLEASSKQTQSQYDGLVRNLKDELKKGELQVRQYKDM